MQNIIYHENLKDYLTKVLSLLLHLIIGLSPLIDYFDNKIRLKFNGGCLKQQNKPVYTHLTIANIFIFMKLELLALSAMVQY